MEKLQENFDTLMDAIVKAKPSAAKGQYVRSCVVSATMGPGVKINPAKLSEINKRLRLDKAQQHLL